MRFNYIMIWLVLLSATLPAFAQYSQPESAVFDEVVGRWLISNAGNGRILQRTADGNVSNFATNIDSPKGLTIVGDTLYVADVTRIRAYRLSTRAALYVANVAGSTFLNDVAADDDYLYVTDMVRNKISRMNLESHAVETYVDHDIVSPNGLFFDRENNRLILVSQRENSPVQAINLEDASVSTIINTQLTELDGIARDGNLNYYISSWGSGAIYRFESDFSNQTMIEEGFDGPADIFYNLRDNILGIPVMSAHRFVLSETPPPQAQLNAPRVVDFGEVTTYLHTELRITWQNTGSEDLIVDSINHSRDGFSLVIEENLRLEPSAHVDLTAAFEPVDSIEYIDTVRVFSNEPTSPRIMIFTGVGLAGPAVAVPDSFGFGRCWVGFESVREIELRNAGIAMLRLDSCIVRRGAGFAIHMPDRRNIPPGETENIEVVFEPYALGDFGEHAFIYSNDPNSPASILLTGFGVRAPTLEIDDGHDFGRVLIGQTASWEVSWLNSGEDTLWIDSVKVTGNGFTVNPPEAMYIAPTETEFTTFTFSPEVEGQHRATVRIYSNDPICPTIMDLEGIGQGFSVDDEVDMPREFAISEGFPTPFNSSRRFELRLPMAVPVKIELFDMQGRMVKKVVERSMSAGVHTIVLDGNDLSAGTFFLTGSAGWFRFSKKVVYLK